MRSVELREARCIRNILPDTSMILVSSVRGLDEVNSPSLGSSASFAALVLSSNCRGSLLLAGGPGLRPGASASSRAYVASPLQAAVWTSPCRVGVRRGAFHAPASACLRCSLSSRWAVLPATCWASLRGTGGPSAWCRVDFSVQFSCRRRGCGRVLEASCCGSGRCLGAKAQR
jgi:hypothetical protein